MKLHPIYQRLSLLPAVLAALLSASTAAVAETKAPAAGNSRYVNPFIGTSNFGATHPGAQYPHALASVAPFNVAYGGALNKFDKDDAWNSRGYIHENRYLTGFSHLNLSGVGCPEAGVLLLMPTRGPLQLDAREYGSRYSGEQASPGYYRTHLDKYKISAELTSTLRTGLSRFTFHGAGDTTTGQATAARTSRTPTAKTTGRTPTAVTPTAVTPASSDAQASNQAHLILNLGLGLTNETGGSVKIVSDSEVEGSRLIGTFCYKPEDVRPLYFVARFSKAAKQSGVFKQMPAYRNVEAEWMQYNNNIKPYPGYRQEMAGDAVGSWFSFDTKPGEQIEVKLGISFVSIANARANLDAEQPGFAFEKTRQQAVAAWDALLDRVQVSSNANPAAPNNGLTKTTQTTEQAHNEQKTLLYTALYHALIHPNILQDVNGDYPLMGKPGVGNSKGQHRYTVYSLWDTNRNVHPLLSLLYPEIQSQMVRSAVAMASESGWLPKWELYGMETQVMVGDPGTVMIADSYLRGIRDFDTDTAFAAMLRAAEQVQHNPLRPENADYLKLGYVPVDDEGPYDGSVSTSLEYYLADFALAEFAQALGKPAEAAKYRQRAGFYQRLFDPTTGMLRPKKRSGDWLSPYNPELGRNFEPAPGYIEGNAWNYRFYVPHDTPGLIKLLGGPDAFVKALDATFATNNFDMTNEPNITYPFLYHYVPGQSWRSSVRVQQLIKQHFGNHPAGLPGNDDTGTMSAWLAFSMLGLYPISPALPDYALVQPAFDEVRLQLNPQYYPGNTLTIRRQTTGQMNANHRWYWRALPSQQAAPSQQALPAQGLAPLLSHFISHQQLVQGGELVVK